VPGQIVKRSRPHTAQDAPDLNHSQLPDMIAGQLIALTARVEALERQTRERLPDRAMVPVPEKEMVSSWEFSI